MLCAVDWRRGLAVLLLVALARAGHHFIRLAILAALGLAGMYMLHMLAQDYNKITSRPSRPAVSATRALLKAITKREVAAPQRGWKQQDSKGSQNKSEVSSAGYMGHILRRVLMQDPLGCARKVVCQLSASAQAAQATGRNKLRPHEAAILRLVRRIEEEETEDQAVVEFRAAQELGKSSMDPEKCSLHYNYCRFEARAVLKLLQSLTR